MPLVIPNLLFHIGAEGRFQRRRQQSAGQQRRR
jgi:hypothetical protein